MRFLGDRTDGPADQVTGVDLGRYITNRLKKRNPGTAERERITLMQFYKWTVGQKYLQASPAAGLAPIKCGVDRPPFRTIDEINQIINRGGLSDDEVLDLWECLYLTPGDSAGLLSKVREKATEDFTYLLHAIPAYTGMRRGEVLRLRWPDVDLDSSYLYARSRKQSRTKTETIRRIDLYPELQKDLIDWRKKRAKGQYVVCDGKTLEPIRVDQANRYFWQPMRGTAWCLKSKPNWFKVGFHTYRHSFASNLAAAGVDQRIIDEWMGHQTEAMRKRYRHLYPKDRRSAIESFTLVQSLHPTSETEGSEG
jgi:integrase